ncbi:sortase B protein-sorting domain-containing protein [Eggerthia catenaformis]
MILFQIILLISFFFLIRQK